MNYIFSRPLTRACSRIVAGREHALVGISALNGYFSQATITELLRWAVSSFATVDVLLPGRELENTLRGRGHAADRVRRKARMAVNNTRNRVCRALGDLAPRVRPVGVFTWSDLTANRAYMATRRRVEALYATDARFRDACLEAVVPVIAGDSGEEVTRERAEIAVPFLLGELPLVVDTPAILGTRSSVFCYPRPMPLVAHLYGGHLPISRAPGQGFLVTRLSRVDTRTDRT
ncbi:tRNA-dependent cyclodipeptide synthase [Sphaerisporangium album]|uniref:Cyclodipeptide synthase n=1 Tax=Sphaerisporangium album TaxID=509200 RepID=A0A367F502_9ACTN|nr:tRNA-dependent cyclodipeptide synthase [Sphaerisporangium album]RCG25009.1 tRNA-dependent cyclodipeptide synthase [Sphaerisporangium album]